jgi:lysophospholipase L1-like esterase
VDQSFGAQSFGAQSFVAQSFVAVGDSFSEGVGDPLPDGSCCRGWADRLAERLAAQSLGFRYANLAIRGKVLREVADEQVPVATAMRPDLVSIAAGGNDLARPAAARRPVAVGAPRGPGLAGRPAAGRAVGEGVRRALAAPPADRRLQRRQHHRQAPGPAALLKRGCLFFSL